MKSPSSRTYILPTGYGLSFAVVCIFLLAVAFASTNNAVYLLCFVMSSLGLQSLVLTNKNIEKIEIASIEIPDFHADETGFAFVVLHNPLLEDVHYIKCEFSKESFVIVEHMKPGERRQVRIPITAKNFGRFPLPKLKLSSEYPFYLARSWKTQQRPSEYYVYPPRKGAEQFPAKAFLLKDSDEIVQDEFKGHRDYRDNDSPRSIDWKVSSRLQKVTVKEYDTEGAKKVWLRWDDVPAGSDLDKKTQLSLWIDLAEKKDYQYGLLLPRSEIAMGSGQKHKSYCLRALI